MRDVIKELRELQSKCRDRAGKSSKAGESGRALYFDGMGDAYEKAIGMIETRLKAIGAPSESGHSAALKRSSRATQTKTA